MGDLHEKKSHDYASDNNPFGNYEFAGSLGSLFKHSPLDIGFVTRIGEKLFRLSNLEGTGKAPKNESIEDTELDICVITVLWMAARRNRRGADTEKDCPQEPTQRQNDQVISAIIALEPLMNKDQVAQIISYLQSCLRDLNYTRPA